jgi:hypothetical protein
MRTGEPSAAKVAEHRPEQIGSGLGRVVPFAPRKRASAIGRTPAFLPHCPWWMPWMLLLARQTTAMCEDCTGSWTGEGSDRVAATHAKVTGHDVIVDDRLMYVVDSRAITSTAGA